MLLIVYFLNKFLCILKNTILIVEKLYFISFIYRYDVKAYIKACIKYKYKNYIKSIY